MQYKDAAIGDTVYFWFAANTTAGTAGDGTTPLFDVRLAGALSTAVPTLSGTPTLLTHANYSDGLYEIAIDTTAWSAGEYAVFCTLTISTVNPAGFCGSFKLVAVGHALHTIADSLLSGVNVATWLGQAVTLSTGNKPDVNIDEISDDTTAPGNLELMFDGTGYAGGTTKLAVDLSATGGVDAVLDEVIEGAVTLRETLRLILSVLTGKSSGGGTATVVFRDIGDTKARISATVDSNGNRTAVGTRDGT